MSVTDMQTWWNTNPWYWSVGTYIGGETGDDVCFVPDRNWVSAIAQQHWQIVFIWNGLQAPCSNNYYKMANDPYLAYTQGVDAANRSYDRLSELGVDEGGAVQYLDIEAFNVNDIYCRNVVNGFIQGWSENLAFKGDRSGVYSNTEAAIRGMINGQCWNTRCPDNVWIAQWPGPDSVWGLGIDDGYWFYHQRLHQAYGDTVECYGGICWLIDSSCQLGQVAGVHYVHNPAFDTSDPRTSHPGC